MGNTKISQTEENYLKAIFKINESTGKSAGNKAISNAMDTSAASVTDMLRRLAKKELIHYESHRGVTLTNAGSSIATNLIRKHRLWEVFLVDKLQFAWDEVHPIAEELEHIKSAKLIAQLDEFLGYPKFDPHGDPIPDVEGNFTFRQQILLSDVEVGKQGMLVGVQEHSKDFLQYLDGLKLGLGTVVEVLERFTYDESVRLRINNSAVVVLSQKVSQNLFIKFV
ncbi:MAG: metal-dependent transcriptional regulator [Bacteroidota bacterium]